MEVLKGEPPVQFFVEFFVKFLACHNYSTVGDDIEKKSSTRGEQRQRKNHRAEHSPGRHSGHSAGQGREQKAQLPTADGSRHSRLDKENAEKEMKNTNIWTQRQREMEKKFDESESAPRDSGKAKKFESQEQIAVSTITF